MAVTRWDHLFGFIHRLAYATLLSGFVWYLTIVPFTMAPFSRGPHLALAKILDFPVAVVSSALPWQMRGIDLIFDERQAEPANMWELLYANLRVGVPVYAVLFYVPNAIVWFGRRLRMRGSKETAVKGGPVGNN